MTTTSKSANVALEDIKNPDAYCLPFWLGFFVIVSQLFIYAIVLANVLRDPVPPNADLVLRLAQVRKTNEMMIKGLCYLDIPATYIHLPPTHL